MEYGELYFKKLDRDCHCKLCDKLVKKNTENFIVFKTIRGHMDTTHLCLQCIENINKLIGKS
jgi:hypothetical protein